MYQGDPQVGTDGKLHQIDSSTRIGAKNGMWLYDLCVSRKPTNSVEIGMAYGFSTIYFLAAIHANKFGHHTAIDPFQNTNWKGIGLTHAKNASKLGVNFEFIEDRSDRAATDLARNQRQFDIIFIDGNHKFDDVLVDFYLYAQLCSIGGYIILDDAVSCRSIRTVVEFIRNNRKDFREISNVPYGWCAFEKIGEDERHWTHFEKFKVASSSQQK